MRKYVSLLLLSLCFTVSMFGQEFRSTLTGRVTDPSGAAVPNAKITVTQTETNAISRTTSGPDGFYTVPFLSPGPYQVAAEAPGFKGYVRSGIQVGAGQRIAVNIQLQLGSTRQTVQVTANAALVNTASAAIGENITSQEVANLPLNGRNPLALVRYSYGVVPKQKHLLNEVKPFDTSGGADIALGGGNSESNELQLNGVPDMSSGARLEGFSPPMDSVDEVKVQLFQSDASYGHTSGGTVDMVTKSGTSQFHGSLYEFNETSALAANPFFLNAAGQQKPVTRQNQYGGSFSGPVVIPKVINGRNKLFFFFAYEGFKDSVPKPATLTVPTAAERNGDFSALLALGPGYQLYNPFTGVLSGGKVVRQPFAGNIIPQSMFNKVAQSYLQYFPSPNQPGAADGANNYVINAPETDDYDAYVGRLDFDLSDRNKIYFELNHSDFTQNFNDYFRTLATGNVGYFGMYQGVLDDVTAISPTFMWDNRVGFMRNLSGSSLKSQTQDFNPATLGFPSYITQHSTQLAMPAVFLSGYQSLSGKPGGKTPFTDLEGFTSGTKVLNKHTLEFGMDFQTEQESVLNPGYSAGWYTFQDNWMRSSSTAAAIPFGGSLASFLLGLPTTGGYDINTNFTYQNYYFAWFLQDNWHARQNLTLDAGLRFEHETPVGERYNREVVGFDPAAANRVTSAAEAAYAANPPAVSSTYPIQPLPAADFKAAGGLVYAAPSRQTGFTEPGLFVSPRIGVAWAPHRLHSSTVIRAGFGMFSNPFGASPYNIGPNYGYSQSTPFVASEDSFLSPFATLSDPYPGGGLLLPVGSALGVNANLGQDISYFYPHLKLPYSMRWTFDIQRQFSKNIMLDVGYVGNRQIDTTMSVNLGALPLQYLSRAATVVNGQLVPVRDQTTINNLSAIVSNPFAGLLPGTGLNGSTTTLAMLLDPYPEFTSVTVQDIAAGYSNFNMLAVRLEKRFSSGLQFNFDYNYSRQLATAALNDGQLSNFWYGVTSSDYPNRFVFSGIYQLPFGAGRHFLNNTRRFTDLILGGWNVAGIWTWESGPALSWGNVIYLGGNIQLDPRNLSHAFDTSRFDTHSRDQLSFNFRTFGPMYNYWRADTANNTDLSLLKDFHLTERVTLQYRFDAFNSLNRAQFGSPNLSPTSKAFGTITSQANTPRAIQMALRLTF